MIIYCDRDKFCISGYVYSVKKLLNTKKKFEPNESCKCIEFSGLLWFYV